MTLFLATVDVGSIPTASTILIFEIAIAGEWRNWQTHLTVSQAVNRRQAHLGGSSPSSPAIVRTYPSRLICGA